MTIGIGDIVTLDHHGKTRMGVILQVGVIPGAAIVAIGYGIENRHDNCVCVCPNTKTGKLLRIYKETTFYARRTHIVSVDCIYPTGRSAPRCLLEQLEPFAGEAIRNNYSEICQPTYPRHRNYSTGSFGVTLGDLLGGKPWRI